MSSMGSVSIPALKRNPSSSEAWRVVTCSCQRKGSLLHRLGRVPQRLADVLRLEIGIYIEDGILGHALCHHAHHYGYRNAPPANAGHASHLIGIDGNTLVFHDDILILQVRFI